MNESDKQMLTLPWQVEAVRFSFINVAEDGFSELFGWSDLMASQPESVTEKRSMGSKTEQGNWLHGTITINRQPGRVDIVYSFIPTQDILNANSLLPNAGPIDEVFSACRELAGSFGKISAARFAFGAILLLPVSDVIEGYSYLSRFLPFFNFEDDMSDFFLQINRRVYADGNIQVNQLSKWGCLSMTAFNIVDGDAHPTPGTHAVRLELDVNTPESNELVSANFSVLATEFIERGLDISAKGAL